MSFCQKLKRAAAVMLAALMALSGGCAVAEEEHPETVPTETVVVDETCYVETEPEATVLETEPVLFSEEITFTCEYVRPEDAMPYALITPSAAADRESLPLIVWLHGMSERDANETWYMGVGLPQVLRDWSLEGFNAYVLCPQLRGEWNEGTWCSPRAAQSVRQLIDGFVAAHNVDTDHIIIGGFSLGGRGALYMGLELPDYFSRMVVLSASGYSDGDIREIQIPVLGCSEYAVSWNAFMKMEFPEVFGEENVWFYDASHPELIGAVFQDDKDGDHRSDIVEWMLSDLES